MNFVSKYANIYIQHQLDWLSNNSSQVMITCYYKLKFHTSSKMLFLSKKNPKWNCSLSEITWPKGPAGTQGET